MCEQCFSFHHSLSFHISLSYVEATLSLWSAATFRLDAVCESLEIALRKSLENVLFADILQMQLHQIIIFIIGKQKTL